MGHDAGQSREAGPPDGPQPGERPPEQHLPADHWRAAEQALHAALDSPCVSDLFGIKLVDWQPGAVILALDGRPELGHQPGWFQGAVTTALAEYAAACSGLTMVPDKVSMTVQQNIHFTGAARGNRLVATGRILSSGRTTSMVAADVVVERDGAPFPCAALTMTMVHRDAPPPANRA